MGILDSKTRLLDTIITLQGRGQIAAGKLKAEFYSFTDSGAFYNQDTSTSASLDGTRRFYLESCNLPQDMITFESDDSGKLVSFKGSNTVVRNGQILTVVSSGLGASSARTYTPAQDNIFSSMTDSLLSSSMDAYANNYILGSPDIFDEDTISFLLGRGSIGFKVSDTSPFGPGERPDGNLESTDGLFVDSRLSHLPNFQYLPPINKFRPGDQTVSVLGNYPNLNQRPQLTFSDVEKEMAWASKLGYAQTIEFNETSKSNNLICQMFEIGGGEIVKLDIIDFGVFNISGEDISLAERQRQEKDPRNRPDISKHVFFVGKVFTDSMGVHKFINLFTLIFEN